MAIESFTLAKPLAVRGLVSEVGVPRSVQISGFSMRPFRMSGFLDVVTKTTVLVPGTKVKLEITETPTRLPALSSVLNVMSPILMVSCDEGLSMLTSENKLKPLASKVCEIFLTKVPVLRPLRPSTVMLVVNPTPETATEPVTALAASTRPSPKPPRPRPPIECATAATGDPSFAPMAPLSKKVCSTEKSRDATKEAKASRWVALIEMAQLFTFDNTLFLSVAMAGE